jgi:hypothetical protein
VIVVCPDQFYLLGFLITDLVLSFSFMLIKFHFLSLVAIPSPDTDY